MVIKKLILLLLVIFIFIGGFIAANFISIPQAKEQPLKQVKLQQQSNPQVIVDEFKQVGELITEKGSITYTNTIVDDGFWGDKKLNLKLKYNYGLGIDLNRLIVKSVVGDTALIQIPKYELKLKYIELAANDSEVTSTKSLLAKQFKPEDVHTILQQAQQKVSDSINLNRSMYDEAFASLEKEIERMVMALGFTSVIIEIV